MVGLVRQGVICDVCGFVCHIICSDKVPLLCPVPADQSILLFFMIIITKKRTNF